MNNQSRDAINLSSPWGEEQIKKAYELVGNGGHLPASFKDFHVESHMACLVNQLLFEIQLMEKQKGDLQEQIEGMTPYLSDEYFGEE